jgi:parallel beta-helix repeat protein
LKVPDAYSSVSLAITASHNGDTILIEKGIYQGGFKLTKDISLVGLNNRTCGLTVSGNKVCLETKQNITIKNLCFRGGAVGIRTLVCTPTISGNLFINNEKAAIHCIISCPTITNNTIINPGISGVYFESVRSRNSKVENNVIANAKFSGFYLAGRSQVAVDNNIITSRKYGVFSEVNSCPGSKRNNCIWAPKQGIGPNCFDPGSTVFMKPDFISSDSISPDFRLKPGSELEKNYPQLGVHLE